MGQPNGNIDIGTCWEIEIIRKVSYGTYQVCAHKIWRFAAVLDHPLSSRFFDLADIHDRPGIEIGVG